MRAARAILLLLLMTSLVRAEGGLPLDVLKSLKSATVFVKAEAGKVLSTGSGFVLRTDKDAVYIVTNHHVVRPTVVVTRGTGTAARPMPMKLRNTRVSVVFGSGTRTEQVASAVIVGDDEKRDLVILKVTGLKDMPAPLSSDRPPELNETMPVWVVGFPFGKALSTSKGNPAITISKGSISSLRLNDAGELAFIQIDGGLNPGNSGGPVVDEKGRLIGIAVARVKDSNIGLVIPSQGLTRMLNGRIDHIHFNLQQDKEAVSIKIEMRLVDPLTQLRSLTFHYAPGAGKGKQPVSTMPEAKQLKMEIKDQQAIGQFSMPIGNRPEVQLTFQTEYVGGDGKPILSEVRVGTLKVTPQSSSTQPGAVPKGNPLSKQELSAALADLKGDSMSKRRSACDRLAAAEPTRDRKEIFAALEPLLTDPDDLTRYRAVRAHLRWANRDALDTYRELLKIDTSAVVRKLLIAGLARLAGAEAADAIAARLAVKVDRAAASTALKSMGPAAEKTLLAYLAHRNAEVRIEACKILEEIGTVNSIGALRKATEGLTRSVAEQVAKAAKDAIDAIKARN